MTDKQIIKALECCSKITNCQVDCSRFNDCILIHIHEVLDLINRQNAEIKELNRVIKNLKATKERNRKEIEWLKSLVENAKAIIKSEVIKEFAEKL